MRVAATIDPHRPGAVAFAQEAERIGVTSLWVPEVWGYDALTGLAFLAAHTKTIGLGTFVVQLGSRSPALLATSALSMQSLSGGRFRLGVGVSGPQVMEGWHGTRFRRPVQSTRETIEIIRTVSRGDRLVHDGEIYPLPLPDSEGRPLRPMTKPDDVPIYIAAMGPSNLRLTGELADGWLANTFIPESADVFLDSPATRCRIGRGRSTTSISSPPSPSRSPTATPQPRRPPPPRRGLGFTIGAMGSARRTSTTTRSPSWFADQIAEVEQLWACGPP